MMTLRSLLFLVLAVAAASSHAAVIDYTSITASTTLTERPSIAPGTWSVDELADGVIADGYPYFGFVSYSSSGTVRLDLDTAYDLQSFSLWNDVNVLNEGVRSFRLDFFDDAATLIGSSSHTAISQFGEQVFNFATVTGVTTVEFVILTSSYQIEVREVAFNGTATSVPVPAAFLLLGFGSLLLLGMRARRAS